MVSTQLRAFSRRDRSEHALRCVPWRGRIEGFVCVAAFCCACDFLLPVRLGLALAGIAYGCWSLWLGVMESRLTVLRVNPLVTYQLWQTGTLGLSPLYIALNYSAEDHVPFGWRFVLPAEIAYGHAILVVGALALYLGMKQFQPKEAIRQSERGRGCSGWELWPGFIVGAALLIFSYEITATVGSVFAGLSFMSLAVLSLVAMKPSASLRRSRGVYWAVLLSGTIILLALNARGDSKMMLSFSFVPLVLATLARRRGGLLIAFSIGFAAVYILVIAPVVANMRSGVRRDERGMISLLDPDASGNVRVQLQSEFRDDPVQYVGSWLDITMRRLGDPVAAGMVSRYVADAGLLHGAGLDYVPMAFIPRLLWRDKPIVARGRYFTVALGMASAESSASTSTGQTAAGELFWNFGWPGVIIGMYLLGAAFSWGWWGADRGDPTNGVFEMTAFIGITLSFVLGSGSDAGTGFVGAIGTGIVLRALIRVRDWVFTRQPRPLGGRCYSGSQ